MIVKVRGTVFYATLHINRGMETVKFDARPSDAVALAIRLDAPIFVDEAVMASASFPSWVNVRQDQQKAEIEEFHNFVEELSQEDFCSSASTGGVGGDLGAGK